MSFTTKEETLTHDGVDFFTKTWTPTGEVVASVLFVHGFIEHIRRYDHVFPKFAEQGIAVFAYDQRGFGATAVGSKSHPHGATTWPHALADISHFLAHASSLHPSVPLYLYGHSMGGGLSLAFPTRVPPSAGADRLAGVIASSPLLRQAKAVKAPLLVVKAGSLVGMLSNKLPIKAEVKAEDTCRDPAISTAYAKDPLCTQKGTFKGVADMLLGGESLMSSGYKHWPNSLPLLIVHGTGDRVTDCSASEEFVNKAKAGGARDAQFKSFDGFFHEMHNEPGDDKWTEISALTSWIKSKLSGSPRVPAARL